MNNFNKEYIELCKDKKVQELRPDELEIGDWIFWNNHLEVVTLKIISPFKSRWVRSHALFLPTGDQLDEEIIKICKERNGYYQFDFTDNKYPNKFFKPYVCLVDTTQPKQNIEVKDDNPLIAKIKLLLSLRGE